jgi:hypothetical protein
MQEIDIDDVLRQLFKGAEAGAPPPPSAQWLLEQARPWWEKSLAQFRGAVRCANSVQCAQPVGLGKEVGRGKPDSDTRQAQVPTVILESGRPAGTRAKVVRLEFVKTEMILRIELERHLTAIETASITLVDLEGKPMLETEAEPVSGGDLRLRVELPDELLEQWRHLRARDPLPFCLIIRPTGAAVPPGGSAKEFVRRSCWRVVDAQLVGFPVVH